MPITDPAVDRYAHDVSRDGDAVLVELAEETRRVRKDHGMLCGPLEGRLLWTLARLCGARRVLEIGTFTGYSALWLASALPADGRVITCDVDPEATAIARRFWARSPHGARIDLRLGPALATLPTLTGPFDLAFIDADKGNYPAYYDAVVPLLRPGGVLAIDNALWGGRVVAPDDDHGRTIDALNRRLREDPRIDNVMLTVRDGVHIAVKR